MQPRFETLATFQQAHPLRQAIAAHLSYSSRQAAGPLFVCLCLDLQTPMRHGDLRRCACGLIWQRYGNNLGIGSERAAQ